MKKIDKNRFRKIYSRFRPEKRIEIERTASDIIEGGLTNSAERFVLDLMLGVSDVQYRWVALFKENPGEEGNLSSEVNGLGYSRKQIEFNQSETENDVTVSSNFSAVTFNALGDWGLVRYIGLFDSEEENAELIWYGNLDEEVQILNSESIIFEAGSITVTID